MAYREIHDISKSLDWLIYLGRLSTTNFDHFLVGLNGLILNYFYYIKYLPTI